jgi:hypothetical protein
MNVKLMIALLKWMVGQYYWTPKLGYRVIPPST